MSFSKFKETALSDVIDTFIDYRGKTPRKTEKGIPLITAKIVKDGLIQNANEFIAYEDYDKWMTRGIPKYGDVVLTVEAPLGEVAQINTYDRVALAQRIITLRGKENILNNDYLKYSIQSGLVQNRLKERATGSTVEGIKSAELKKVLIPLPEYDEQIKVAKILKALDNKIQISNQINNNLQSLSQLLFKHWFIDFEFPNEEGLPYKSSGGEMFDSELGMIPKAWEVKSIGEIAEVIDCLHSKKPERCPEGHPFLQLNNIRDDGLLDITDLFLISENDYKRWISRLQVSEGDCVITNVGRVGAVSQVPENIKAAIGRNMTCIRCKPSFLYPTFLIECLLSGEMRKEIERKTDSGTILNALNVKNIPKLRFVCPNKEITLRFEQTVRPIRKLMERNLEKSRYLSTIRDILLPKLMNGEIDLTNLEINL